MQGFPMIEPFTEMESQVGDIVIRTRYEGIEHRDSKIFNIYETKVVHGPEFMMRETLRAFGEEEAGVKHVSLCFLIDRLLHKYKGMWWRWVAWPKVRAWLFFH